MRVMEGQCGAPHVPPREWQQKGPSAASPPARTWAGAQSFPGTKTRPCQWPGSRLRMEKAMGEAGARRRVCGFVSAVGPAVCVCVREQAGVWAVLSSPGGWCSRRSAELIRLTAMIPARWVATVLHCGQAEPSMRREAQAQAQARQCVRTVQRQHGAERLRLEHGHLLRERKR